MKIPNILTFNEPDLSAHGGSNVNPAYGAQVWFLENCSRIIGQHCAYDFVTLHLYDPFEGLASQMGEYVATRKGIEMYDKSRRIENGPEILDAQSRYGDSFKCSVLAARGL
ncbi:hypothetical protein J7T55_002218 [Diaporthe amygdali]|uniref:uncharacterized protein n=1 Tax=Phomopsis amygdali TaxID=1214568 RepID=UPI0022FDFB66|nr:uncharacterized protein J7T55_002218 [Diaporthe amygdali]KAJ0109026.1 hypothetical protein J7T55_002218 [Diaporthe amygdali]